MAIVVTCCIALSGCASNASKRADKQAQEIEAKYSQLMRDAEVSVKNNQKDQALSQFSEAAKINPVRLEPWQRIAQLQFERTNYVEAAVAAQEVLQRNAPTADGVEAQSILAVSGLRLSVRSLAELRGNDFLNGDVRREAETLAQTLRVTLNETVLVPGLVEASEEQEKTPPPATKRKQKAATATKAATTDKPKVTTENAKAVVEKGGQAVQSAKSVIPDSAISGDPFGALK